MTENEKNAKIFCKAIKDLASDENSINNLECYLTHHFDAWMVKFANTPENISNELKHFATIK